MLVENIKTKMYQIISSLGYEVIDRAQGKQLNHFPVIKIALAGLQRDYLKNSFMYRIRFKIDIFSSYEGEKEILDIEEKIADNLSRLYEIPGIVYIRESDCKIIDDKSTSVVRKHGIVSYTITSAGGTEENEQNNSASS